jgi:hypothetical protein
VIWAVVKTRKKDGPRGKEISPGSGLFIFSLFFSILIFLHIFKFRTCNSYSNSNSYSDFLISNMIPFMNINVTIFYISIFPPIQILGFTSGASDRCFSGPVTVRCIPDSPVHYLTVGAVHVSPADCTADRWRWRPVANRTVQCATRQSGEL